MRKPASELASILTVLHLRQKAGGKSGHFREISQKSLGRKPRGGDQLDSSAIARDNRAAVTTPPFLNWRMVMSRFLFACAVAMTAVNARAADDSDAKAMQGTWIPAKAELAGQAWPDEVLKTIVLKIDGDKYEATVGGKLDRGTCTLDTAARPKGMTLNGTEGPNKGKTFHCIFEISGDTLRVCYDLSGRSADEFATAAGTPLYLVTYTRKKERSALTTRRLLQVKIERLLAGLDFDGRAVAGRIGRHEDFRRRRGGLSRLGRFGHVFAGQNHGARLRWS